MAGFLDEVKGTVLTERNASDLKRCFEKEIEKLIPFWAKFNVDKIKKSVLETAKRTPAGKVIRGSTYFDDFEFHPDGCERLYSRKADLMKIIEKMDTAGLLKEYPEFAFDYHDYNNYMGRLSGRLYRFIKVRIGYARRSRTKTREVKGFLGIKKQESYQEDYTAAVLAGYGYQLREEITRQAAREGIVVHFRRDYDADSYEYGSEIGRERVEAWDNKWLCMHYEVRI